MLFTGQPASGDFCQKFTCLLIIEKVFDFFVHWLLQISTRMVTGIVAITP